MKRIIRRVTPGNAGGLQMPGQGFKGSNTNTPQFPGMQKGKTQEQVKEFIKDQVRRFGMRISGGTTPTDFDVKLPGNGRFLYGIAFLNDFSGVTTLDVNNEVVFKQIDNGFLMFGKTEQDYFAVNRPLSGSDVITLTVTGDSGYTNQPFVAIYK